MVRQHDDSSFLYWLPTSVRCCSHVGASTLETGNLLLLFWVCSGRPSNDFQLLLLRCLSLFASLCSHCRTPDGDMFVVKDPDLFAASVIPQYFDHNKFSSFARQLNFYGFRKMQSKPIRNSDFDENTAKHVTFFNENFKRGRCDLLKKIQRSTRGGGTTPGQDQQREIQTLKDKVTSLETTISDMNGQVEERMRRLELDMLGRMEQIMLAIQQQQHSSVMPKPGTTTSSEAHAKMAAAKNSQGVLSAANAQNILGTFGGLDPLPYGARATSIGSISGLPGFTGFGDASSLGMSKALSTGTGPTLPPHPKQKQLPTANIPGTLNIPPTRLASLGALSNFSRGISNLSRGASIESQSSAFLNNAFEDKFLSMLMNGENKAALNAQLNLDSMNPTPMADTMIRQAMAKNAAALSNGSSAAARI